MFEYLNAVNFEKKNLLREATDLQEAQKGYPMFVVNKGLSYHQDAILLVNELNTRGLEEFGVTPLMNFEFYLYTLSKRKRFSKWAKSEKDEKVDLLVEFFDYSKSKALEVVDIVPESTYDELRELKNHKI